MTEPTKAELAHMRKLRALRVRAAEKANVAIGWVTADGKVNPKAPQLPKRPKDVA